MKVDELTGVDLDYWVAKSEGEDIKSGSQWIEDLKIVNDYILKQIQPDLYYVDMEISENDKGGTNFYAHQNIIDWDFIGQIIEEIGGIHVYYQRIMSDTDEPEYRWFAEHGIHDDESEGSTALEAIKRCIVKREYGESVK